MELVSGLQPPLRICESDREFPGTEYGTSPFGASWSGLPEENHHRSMIMQEDQDSRIGLVRCLLDGLMDWLGWSEWGEEMGDDKLTSCRFAGIGGRFVQLAAANHDELQTHHRQT